MEAYKNAIVALYEDQKRRGENNNPYPMDASVSMLLDNVHKQEFQRSRENFEDRGVGTIKDGYSTSEELAMITR